VCGRKAYLMNTAVAQQFLWKANHLISTCTIVIFSRRARLHGVDSSAKYKMLRVSFLKSRVADLFCKSKFVSIIISIITPICKIYYGYYKTQSFLRFKGLPILFSFGRWKTFFEILPEFILSVWIYIERREIVT
jgi:hypothetical protein